MEKDELNEVLPFAEKAHQYLNSIQKKHISQVKALAKPPQIIHEVLLAVAHLLAGLYPDIETNSQGQPVSQEWKLCLRMCRNPSDFVEKCMELPSRVGQDQVLDRNIDRVKHRFLGSPQFNVEFVKSKSYAAMYLCGYVQSMVQLKQGIYRVMDNKLREH